MSYYIIIRGPAGIGKTTIAKTLQEKLKGVYVSFDEAVRKFQQHAKDGEGLAKESFLMANASVADEAKREIENGKVVIFDGCFYHKEQIEDLVKLLPYKYFAFDLKASVETCIERDKTRKSIGVDAIGAVYSFVSKFDFGIPVNTEEKTSDDVAEEILTIIKNGT